MVTLLDPLEIHRCVNQVNNEGQDGYLDHIYNITYAMENYVNLIADGKLT